MAIVECCLYRRRLKFLQFCSYMVSRNYLVLSHSYLRLVQVFVQYVLFGFCR